MSLPGRLTCRKEFLATAASGRKWATPGLVLQVRPHDAKFHPPENGPAVRAGFTATKKIGGAVQRNRAKRRLRAAVQQVFPAHAVSGHDYVLIARLGTGCRPWLMLLDDLETALKKLGVWKE